MLAIRKQSAFCRVVMQHSATMHACVALPTRGVLIDWCEPMSRQYAMSAFLKYIERNQQSPEWAAKHTMLHGKKCIKKNRGKAWERPGKAGKGPGKGSGKGAADFFVPYNIVSCNLFHTSVAI